MKITIIGQDDIYLDDNRGRQLMQQVASGAEYVIIDGNMYKASTITAITQGDAPASARRIGGVADDTGGFHEVVRASTASEGYKKYLLAKQKLLGSKTLAKKSA